MSNSSDIGFKMITMNNDHSILKSASACFFLRHYSNITAHYILFSKQINLDCMDSNANLPIILQLNLEYVQHINGVVSNSQVFSPRLQRMLALGGSVHSGLRVFFVWSFLLWHIQLV